MFLDAPKHLSPTAEYLLGLIGAMVIYVPLFGLLFIWLFNSFAALAKRPRLAVVGICVCVAVLCIFLGGRDAPLVSIGIWLIIGFVFWGKKENTPPSPLSEREKLLAERYTNAVAAKNEALERSKELEAEFQRMSEK